MRQASPLWPHLRILQAWGANTEVGKTIFSSVLSRAATRRSKNVKYLKPISTGALDDADDGHIKRFGTGVQSKTVYQFSDPVSPHLAARESSLPTNDDAVRSKVYQELASYANTRDGIAIVETAGGVLSPAPSGSTQADLYRPLRLPAFLVGDPRLGGIGSTISAWESLHIRGYDVQSVALFAEERYGNHAYLKDYFADRGVHSFSIAPPPERKASADEDARSMEAYYDDASSDGEVALFLNRFLAAHDKRCEDLQAMPSEADKSIWHPFMQHRERNENTIVAMDSAYDDYFQTYMKPRDAAHATPYETSSSKESETSLLTPAFDASASWWTQGLGHGNPHLALTAAHAAGRYGHVMFAGAVHEPALTLAQTLLRDMNNPRLTKIFFSDNGSTGMEVAVKMALRTASKRNGWSASKDKVEILGLLGSYHGDTIGTMDCSEPSIYNEKVEWYSPRGHWMDYPTVKLRRGQWLVETPPALHSALGSEPRTFASLDEIFDLSARAADAEAYKSYISSQLKEVSSTRNFGALIMEPVILGAGGMNLADPLYQHVLVTTVRHLLPNVPVIFDEVFTGLYRLGRFSAASFLQAEPDIVVNAKLLTGGLLPLCTTAASEEVFEAFLSHDKSEALLHGHSYTAHAVGCQVANESLKLMGKLSDGEDWQSYKQVWGVEKSATSATAPQTWSMWSQDFVYDVSHSKNVDSVFAIGSVFAMTLTDPSGSGYASTAATGLRDRLFAGDGKEEPVIHSRVLGNVLYLMGAMTSTPETLRGVEMTVLKALKEA